METPHNELQDRWVCAIYILGWIIICTDDSALVCRGNFILSFSVMLSWSRCTSLKSPIDSIGLADQVSFDHLRLPR